MTKAQVRFLVLVSFVLALWRAFEIPAVNEATWDFLTLGLVPGTDTMLSAETVIRGSLALFVLTVFLIFRKEFMASIPATWFGRNKKPITVRRVATPVVAVLPVRPISKNSRSPFVRTLGYLVGWIVYALSVLGAATENALRFMAFCLGRATRVVWQVAVATALRLWAYGVKVWYFAEPFLRDFDQWLNVTVHKNKFASEVIDILDACWKELRSRWQRADVRARNVLEDR